MEKDKLANKLRDVKKNIEELMKKVALLKKEEENLVKALNEENNIPDNSESQPSQENSDLDDNTSNNNNDQLEQSSEEVKNDEIKNNDDEEEENNDEEVKNDEEENNDDEETTVTEHLNNLRQNEDQTSSGQHAENDLLSTQNDQVQNNQIINQPQQEIPDNPLTILHKLVNVNIDKLIEDLFVNFNQCRFSVEAAVNLSGYLDESGPRKQAVYDNPSYYKNHYKLKYKTKKTPQYYDGFAMLSLLQRRSKSGAEGKQRRQVESFYGLWKARQDAIKYLNQHQGETM